MARHAPEFVQNFSSLTLLTAEEIRLAKRNTESHSLVVALDNCLQRLCNVSNPQGIADILTSYGYPRSWSLSVRERLTAITFLVIIRNLWGRKISSDIPATTLDFPNLSMLWCHHFFPLNPPGTRLNSSTGSARDMHIQSYGRISQKLRMLKNLEQCHSRLIRKVESKLQMLLNMSNSKSPLKGKAFEPRVVLAHCKGFLIPQASSGSSQEGSLRRLRDEVSKVDEIIEISLRKHHQFEKYLEWIGVESVATASNSVLNEELIRCADMISSVESVLPLLLANGRYNFDPTIPMDDQRSAKHASTEFCLRHLTTSAVESLEKLASTDDDQQVLAIGAEESRVLAQHPEDNNLDLAMTSLLLSRSARSSSEIEEALQQLRLSHQEVLLKTMVATKKYSPYEFDSHQRR